MTPAERAKLPPADVPRDGPKLTGEKLDKRLAATWSNPPGLIGWLSSVDHKDIGRRYVITALAFLALAGALAIVMRLQLAKPDNDLVGAARYNEIFTMHGTTMMFLFAVPVMQGMQIYLTPLMLGTRANAFPRLNAFSYWTYLAGGLLLWIAFVLNIAPDIGWFAYPPLSGPQYGVGKRADIWAQMVTFTEVAALAAAVSLTATILKQRAPGMSVGRMPIFVWSTLVTSLMVIFSMPSVALASGMLLSDRLIGTHFYNPAEQGDALLWQHLFWFFGTPRFTSSSCPQPASSARSWPPSRGGRSSCTRSWSWRWSPRASSPSACGCTTCSPPACRGSATASTQRRAWPCRSRPACRYSAGSRPCGKDGRASRCRCSTSSASSSPS
jgi:cytochrome c oxidase subunit 1